MIRFVNSRIFMAAVIALGMLVSVSSFSSRAAAKEEVHDAMENVIGPAFKTLSTDLRAGTIKPTTVQAGIDLLASFKAIRGFFPDDLPDGRGGNRAFTVSDQPKFTSEVDEMIVLADKMVTALKANDVTAASTTLTEMGALKQRGHTDFRAEH